MSLDELHLPMKAFSDAIRFAESPPPRVPATVLSAARFLAETYPNARQHFDQALAVLESAVPQDLRESTARVSLVVSPVAFVREHGIVLRVEELPCAAPAA